MSSGVFHLETPTLLRPVDNVIIRVIRGLPSLNVNIFRGKRTPYHMVLSIVIVICQIRK